MLKVLQLPFKIFFFSFLSLFWTEFQKLFSERFKISYPESVSPRSDLFLGHMKNISVKIVPEVVIRRAWHMTRLIHGNKHSKHPKKTHKKQPETG